MPRRSTLRASDADREGVAERLRKAATEGRLTTQELDERLAAAFRARTYGELDPLVGDLPSKAVAPRRRGGALAMTGPVAITLVSAAAIVVAFAAIAVVAMISAAWIGWMVFAWIFFGGRRGHHRGYNRRLAAPPRSHPGAANRARWM